MEVVKIYTDGACSGNPGPGGWGVLLSYKGHEKELSGNEESATNNRMELIAAIKGLEALTRPCKVELYSDSKYVINGCEEWLKGWKYRNWKTSTGDAVKNKDLWVRMDQLIHMHDMSYVWVKGHNGHPENERVDILAVEAKLKIM